MDLKQLEYFVRVAELGSFTRASVVLNIAQPALSRQIRLLEVELRQTLLLRNGRGALPTDAGKLLLEHARGILHQVARAREELGRVRGALAGRVAVGLPPSLARKLTVPLTRAFRQHLPDAALSITEGLSSAMHESLSTGRLDIALLYNAAPTPDLTLEPLLVEELFLVKPRIDDSPAAPMSLREVATHPLVIPSRPNALRALIEGEMAQLGCRPKVALEIDGVPAILDLVADDAGCAVLSRHALDTSLRPETYALHPIHSPALRSQLYLATSALRPATLTLQSTLTLIRQLVAPLIDITSQNLR
jgi:LysR family transcriptional regulator, nitrogen assimilation regulatory protein